MVLSILETFDIMNFGRSLELLEMVERWRGHFKAARRLCLPVGVHPALTAVTGQVKKESPQTSRRDWTEGKGQMPYRAQTLSFQLHHHGTVVASFP